MARSYRVLYAALTLLAVLVLSSCRADAPVPDVQPGMLAPPLELDAVRGGSYQVGERVTLLAFLNTQADPAASTPDLSRSQIVFLRSMREQYPVDQVDVVIVDGSALVSGAEPDQDSLINYAYDQHLDSIPLLLDPGGEAAYAYGVSALPTTFLIGADGAIRQRWDGFAASSDLGMGIRHALGLDVFGTPLSP